MLPQYPPAASIPLPRRRASLAEWLDSPEVRDATQTWDARTVTDRAELVRRGRLRRWQAKQ